MNLDTAGDNYEPVGSPSSHTHSHTHSPARKDSERSIVLNREDTADPAALSRESTSIKLTRQVTNNMVEIISKSYQAIVPNGEEVYPWMNVLLVAITVGTIEVSRGHGHVDGHGHGHGHGRVTWFTHSTRVVHVCYSLTLLLGYSV
jgi:hypothetical protein